MLSKANNFISFLEDTLDRLEGKTMKCIIVARHYSTIQRKIANIKTWWTEADGLQVASTEYQGTKWEKPRHLIVVRQKISQRQKATGKQLKFFKTKEYMGIIDIVAISLTWNTLLK